MHLLPIWVHTAHFRMKITFIFITILLLDQTITSNMQRKLRNLLALIVNGSRLWAVSGLPHLDLGYWDRIMSYYVIVLGRISRPSAFTWALFGNVAHEGRYSFNKHAVCCACSSVLRPSSSAQCFYIISLLDMFAVRHSLRCPLKYFFAIDLISAVIPSVQWLSHFLFFIFITPFPLPRVSSFPLRTDLDATFLCLPAPIF